jgi:drug/metabolite transporter (DMT)-like permease
MPSRYSPPTASSLPFPKSDLQANISSRTSRGYIICVTATILWSTTGVLIRYITEYLHMPPLLLAFWRDVLVCAALALTLTLVRPGLLRLERRHFPFVVAYGLILSLFNSLWTISVAYNGAAVSTVLAYSSAAFTAILGWRLYHERLDLAKGTAIVLSMLGCFLVSGAYRADMWRLNLPGIVTGLLSGLAFATYSLIGKASSLRRINPWSMMVYGFGSAIPFLLLYNLLPLGLPHGLASSQLLWLGKSLIGWGVLALLAFGPTIGGFGLYTVSMGYLQASVANLIATLEPAMTAGLAYLLLGERLSPIQLSGSAMILAAVALLRLREGRHNSINSPDGVVAGGN